MYVVVFATDKPGVADLRNETREEHRAYLRDHPAHPDVVLLHGGPTLADDGESANGLLMVVEAPSVDAARAFLADSPYEKAGVLAESQVREFDWVTGSPG